MDGRGCLAFLRFADGRGRAAFFLRLVDGTGWLAFLSFLDGRAWLAFSPDELIFISI